jgi:hypothetical protein
VHRDVGNLNPGDPRVHLGIRQPAGDVVDQGGTCADGRLGDLRAHRVDADHQPVSDELLNHGQDPAQLLVGGDPVRTGARGLPSDVDDVGPRRCLLQRMGHGDVRLDVAAPIGEGVRGHVQHGHHQGATLTGKGVGHPERVHP